MAPALPSGFFDINTASNSHNREVNVMGRVTDYLAPRPSRGTDMMSSFSLTDSSYEGSYGEGLKIRFFKPSEREHPQIRSTGDVVLLRRLNVKEYRGVTMGLSTIFTSWVVFPLASIPEKAPQNRLAIKHLKPPSTGDPTHTEMLYAIELCNLRDRRLDKSYGNPIPGSADISGPSTPSTAVASQGPVSSMKTGGRLSYGGRDKFGLIKDFQISTYYDMVGQVIKTYSNTGRLEMYITDYSGDNRMLYRYEWDKEDKENDYSGGYYSSFSKSKKWQGPYGQMTLMIALWPPHSYFAQNHVNEGDFVFIQNVHIKQDRDCKMEGALHEDKFRPEKIQISLLNDHSDERVKEVLRRKRIYAEKFESQSKSYLKDVERLRQSGDQGNIPMSKHAARKKRKAEREKQAAEEKAAKKQKKNQKQPRFDKGIELPPSSPEAEQSPPPRSVIKSNRTDLNKNGMVSPHCTYAPLLVMDVLDLNTP